METSFLGGSSAQAAAQKVQPETNVDFFVAAKFERFVLRPDLTEAVLVATGFKEVRTSFVFQGHGALAKLISICPGRRVS